MRLIVVVPASASKFRRCCPFFSFCVLYVTVTKCDIGVPIVGRYYGSICVVQYTSFGISWCEPIQPVPDRNHIRRESDISLLDVVPWAQRTEPPIREPSNLDRISQPQLEFADSPPRTNLVVAVV